MKRNCKPQLCFVTIITISIGYILISLQKQIQSNSDIIVLSDIPINYASIFNISIDPEISHQSSPNTIKHPLFGEYECLVQNGCQLHLPMIPHFTNKSIIILALAKDIQKSIRHSLQQIDQLLCIFKNSIFLIYESDSSDNTPEILNQWLNEFKNYSSFCSQINSQNITSKNNRNLFIYKQNFYIFNKTQQNFVPNSVRKQRINIVMTDKQKELISEIKRMKRMYFLRNNLLHETKKIVAKSGMTFDYFMMIDFDFREIDSAMLMNELHVLTERHVNEQPFVMCANGIFVPGFMRDTFATVFENGSWAWPYVWYFETDHELYKYKYELLYNWPMKRFQHVRSCFGGLSIYSQPMKIFQSKCDYNFMENGTVFGNDSFSKEWKEISIFRNQLQISLEHDHCPKECTLICEHIPYHYCLGKELNYNFYISRESRLWYQSFNEMLLWATENAESNFSLLSKMSQKEIRLHSKLKGLTFQKFF